MPGLMQPVKGQGRRPHRTGTGRVLAVTETGSGQDATGTGEPTYCGTYDSPSSTETPIWHWKPFALPVIGEPQTSSR